MASQPNRLSFRRGPNSTQTDHTLVPNIEATLKEIDPQNQFSHPAFDPLQHAISLLSSVDAEPKLQQLREHYLAVDAVLDGVVEARHGDFNQSLKNYSEILQLFHQCHAHVNTLRRELELAQERLHPDTEQLRDLYRRNVKLTEMCRLLNDIQQVVSVPSTVAELEQRGDWSLAVSTLLDASNKVSREEIVGIGAIQQLKQQLKERRMSLMTTLTTELERVIYERHFAVKHTDQSPTLPMGARTMPRTLHTRQRSVFGGGSIGQPSPSPLHRSLHRRAATIAGIVAPGGYSESNTPGQAIGTALKQHHHLRARSTAGLEGGHLMDDDSALNTLVQCVAQLGGVYGVTQTLRSHMPSKVHGMILQSLESFHRFHPSVEPKSALSRATQITETVASRCLACFRSIARLLQLLALAKPPAASAGLEMLMDDEILATDDSSVSPIIPSSPSIKKPKGIDALQESLYAWECIQLEYQEVLAAILEIPLPTRRARRALEPDLPPGWLASDAGKDKETSDGMPTSKDEQDAQPAIPSIGFSLMEELSVPQTPATTLSISTRTASKTSREQRNKPMDIKALIAVILGGRDDVGVAAERVVAVYKSTATLVDSVDKLLLTIEHAKTTLPMEGNNTNSSPSTPTASRISSLLAAPFKVAAAAASPFSQSSPATPSDRRASLLLSYLDTFFRMDFLPSVYVQIRSQCRELLESGRAFTLKATGHPASLSTYQPGMNILPAATETVAMAERVLDWASRAPPFATSLAGVLENVLGKILEAFQSSIDATLGDSLAGQWSNAVDIVQLLAKESSAQLLGTPVAFFIGSNADKMDAFVSSAIAAGFGSSQTGIERELVARLLAGSVSSVPSAHRPVQKGALLTRGTGELQRVFQLAVVAHSADYIADSIHAAAAAAAFSTSIPGDSTSPRAATPRRAAEAWKRHLTGMWKGGGANVGGENYTVDKGFAEGLAHAADRYRAIAGQCIRALRLEMAVLAVHHLEHLPKLSSFTTTSSHSLRALNGGAEDYIVALGRTIASIDEALTPLLPPDRRLYIFGSLPPLVNQLAISLLSEFPSTFDTATVSKVCKILSALQPVLCRAGGLEGVEVAAGRPDPMKQLEKAKLYYSLLTHSSESLLNAISAKPLRFSMEEYKAVIGIRVSGRRAVDKEQKAQVMALLREASRGKK